MENEIVAKMAVNLGEAVVRNSAGFIFDKIKTMKKTKTERETITELEAIIYDLLNDKAELQQISQAFEQELVSQRITKKDIKYITDNLLPIFSKFIPEDKVNEEQIKSILSVETLTIMQLIGFNYKKAIGEPLTLLLKKAIEMQTPVDPKLNMVLINNMATLAQDEEATKRYYQLTGLKPNNE